MSRKIVNVPNILTTARLLLAVAVFALIPLHYFWPAFVVFVVAAATDWVDRYWARRYGQVTQVGRIYDPFVDKILVCGAFIFLAAERCSGIYAWMAVVVVAREMLVTGLRSFIEQHGGDFSAKMSGKLKMVFQCIAAGTSLVALTYAPAEPPLWIAVTLIASVWVAILSTLYSGVVYVIAATQVIRIDP